MGPPLGRDLAASQGRTGQQLGPVWALAPVGVDGDGGKLRALLIEAQEAEPVDKATAATVAGVSAVSAYVEQRHPAHAGLFQVIQDAFDQRVAGTEEVDPLVADGVLAVEGAQEAGPGGDAGQLRLAVARTDGREPPAR